MCLKGASRVCGIMCIVYKTTTHDSVVLELLREMIDDDGMNDDKSTSIVYFVCLCVR